MELAAFSACALIAGPALAGSWVTYTNETSVRVSASSGLFAADTEEKDYAYGDVDQDNDVDLVIVRKQPFTTPGGRENVLLMNVNGVLTDQTSQYIPDFSDGTNDRDVELVDVNNDTWLDIVTAAACNSCNTSTIVDDSRLYLNLGDGGDGIWDGYGPAQVLLTGHNFCHVGVGDVTGDDYADLYFVSYEDTLDQLMINGGAANPGTFTVQNNRLTSAMQSSGFGTSAWIVDMNGDNTNDIVKSENVPVEIFNNDLNNEGYFNIQQSTYTGSAYHSGVGDLNNDDKMDIVVSDDGTDRYLINTGNGGNGMANFSNNLLPELPIGSGGGFGSDSYIIDLDGDNWRDIIVCDVDVDAFGCSRISHIYHNNGGASFTRDAGNLTNSNLTGVHDIAAFDINGDTFLDLVIGRCAGTQVWINSQPIEIAFSYPNGLPGLVTPNQTTDFAIQMVPTGDTIVPGSELLFASVNDGPFTSTPLTFEGGNDYTGTLPAAECADKYDFYISAQLNGGLTFTDPATAPGSTYNTVAAEGTELVLEETMESAVNGDVPGWTVSSDPSLTAGAWEAVVPLVTTFNEAVANPPEDASPVGEIAYVTENPAFPNETASLSDVDWGPTYLISPVIDLDGTDAFITYSYWVFSDLGVHDLLTLEVSNNDGSTWTQVESLNETGGAWASSGFLVGRYVTPTAEVRVRFSATDNPNDSVTEGGVDDFTVSELTCGCVHDLDGSGDVGVTDLLDLLAAWGTDPGGPPDFNGDGDVNVTDLLAMLAVWGPC